MRQYYCLRERRLKRWLLLQSTRLLREIWWHWSFIAGGKVKAIPGSVRRISTDLSAMDLSATDPLVTELDHPGPEAELAPERLYYEVSQTELRRQENLGPVVTDVLHASSPLRIEASTTAAEIYDSCPVLTISHCSKSNIFNYAPLSANISMGLQRRREKR